MVWEQGWVEVWLELRVGSLGTGLGRGLELRVGGLGTGLGRGLKLRVWSGNRAGWRVWNEVRKFSPSKFLAIRYRRLRKK